MEDAHLVVPQVKLVLKQESSTTCIWWTRLFRLLFFLWPSHSSSFSDPWCDFLSELQKEKKLGNAGSPILRSPGRVWRDSFTDNVYPGQKPAARPAGLKHKLLRLVKHLCPKHGQRRSEAAEFWWIFISVESKRRHAVCNSLTCLLSQHFPNDFPSTPPFLLLIATEEFSAQQTLFKKYSLTKRRCLSLFF